MFIVEQVLRSLGIDRGLFEIFLTALPEILKRDRSYVLLLELIEFAVELSEVVDLSLLGVYRIPVVFGKLFVSTVNEIFPGEAQTLKHGSDCNRSVADVHYHQAGSIIH